MKQLVSPRADVCVVFFSDGVTRMSLHEPVSFVRDYLSPYLDFEAVKDKVAVHVPCTSKQAGLTADFVELAGRCATEVVDSGEGGGGVIIGRGPGGGGVAGMETLVQGKLQGPRGTSGAALRYHNLVLLAHVVLWLSSVAYRCFSTRTKDECWGREKLGQGGNLGERGGWEGGWGRRHGGTWWMSWESLWIVGDGRGRCRVGEGWGLVVRVSHLVSSALRWCCPNVADPATAVTADAAAAAVTLHDMSSQKLPSARTSSCHPS